MKALGMIEVYGRIGAIEGLDASLKSADVSIVNLCKVGGGLTAIFVEGDVGAVKAAIDSGASAAEKVGKLIASHVIPRPAESTRTMIAPDWKRQPQEEVCREPENTQEVNPATTPEVNPATTPEVELTEDDLQKKHINELRRLVKSIPDFEMTPQEITSAKKEVIVEAILKRKGEK
jgi:microcompartment protein CcmL/EutN